MDILASQIRDASSSHNHLDIKLMLDKDDPRQYRYKQICATILSSMRSAGRDVVKGLLASKDYCECFHGSRDFGRKPNNARPWATMGATLYIAENNFTLADAGWLLAKSRFRSEPCIARVSCRVLGF